ncbi:hypothetical protein OTU49_005622 [Cherax quadricarinatus]|uniref:Uncharacterized protein n=1 Tax=Cherax quadricarinatus TaxID=27406 RepID=A0AAW0X6G8_CHEQU
MLISCLNIAPPSPEPSVLRCWQSTLAEASTSVFEASAPVDFLLEASTPADYPLEASTPVSPLLQTSTPADSLLEALTPADFKPQYLFVPFSKSQLNNLVFEVTLL